MERIIIFKRTIKTEGKIRLRFRLRDGRSIDLYHKSIIEADLKRLDRQFTIEGLLKPRVSVYDKELFNAIAREREAMSKAYGEMRNKGLPMTNEVFEDMIDRFLHPEKMARNISSSLLSRFDTFIRDGYNDGIFGEGRMKHYYVVYHELERFLIINNLDGIIPVDFTADHLMKFSHFLRDEYLQVKRHLGLYAKMTERNIPKERRSMNTVATKLKKMQSFFNELEDKEEIVKSPFRKLGKERKRSVMKEKYDEPVFLYKSEFMTIMYKEVPQALQETKDVFLLQCAFGCRIGDFQNLSMEKVGVNKDGIPFIHYLPRKTIKEQKDHSEIETPIMRYALDIIKKYRFQFPVLKYVSGKSGYNAKIKILLEYCGIDRQCTVFNEEKNDNDYKPLYVLGSSKLCRKTHVDMINKVQIDKYAAGLHSKGSDAVDRYTTLELRDRFVMMCAAFDQPVYKVDNELNVIE